MLAAVQAEIAGEDIAHRAGDGGDAQILPAEDLHREKDGGNGTVDGAAEQRYHSHRGGQPRIKAQQRTDCRAEGGPDKKYGYDLTAAVARRQCHRGKQKLQDTGSGLRGHRKTDSDL